MTEIFLRRGLAGFDPVDDAGREMHARLPFGEIVKSDMKRPRNQRHHRLFWALMELVFQNQERYATKNLLVAAIKTATGHADVIEIDDGRTILIPKSISFAKMDQTEFDAFYNRVCDVVCTRIIPNLKQEDLKREVAEMVGAL